MLKNLVRSCVRPFGLDIIKFPRVPPLAVQLRDLIKSNGVNLVLDVGACEGGFVKLLRGPAEYRGRVVSFEPTDDTFLMLSKNLKSDGDWRGYNLGIGDANSAGIINTYGESRDFNSILTLRDDGAQTYGVNLAHKREQPIQIRTIDSLWDELVDGIPNPIVYLKTDTQGHDPAVIKGAAPRFQQIAALQTEVPAVGIYDGMESMPDTLRNLDAFGYAPFGFHPVNQPEGRNGMAPEYDVIFMRKDLIAPQTSVRASN